MGAYYKKHLDERGKLDGAKDGEYEGFYAGKQGEEKNPKKEWFYYDDWMTDKYISSYETAFEEAYLKAYEEGLKDTSVEEEEPDKLELYHFATLIKNIGIIFENHYPQMTLELLKEKDSYYTTANGKKWTSQSKAKVVLWSNADSWAFDELNKAFMKNLIPQTLYSKDFTKTITRKDTVAIAVKMYEALTGKTAVNAAENPFTDTNDEYVLKAYVLGITNGTSEDKFSPDDEITREQMAVMLTRALEKAGIDCYVDWNTVQKFADDGDFNDWGRNSIYFMSGNGIIKGVGDNRFDSMGNAKIEEAIVIALRSAEKFSK